MTGDAAPMPILLRPSAALAAAMAKAAEESGCSRQAWMLAVLTDAVTELGHYPPTGATPEDVPLWPFHPCPPSDECDHKECHL